MISPWNGSAGPLKGLAGIWTQGWVLRKRPRRSNMSHWFLMVLTEVQASCRLVSYFGFGTGGIPVPLNHASQSTLFKIAVSSSDPEKCLKRRSFQSCVSSALYENASIYADKNDRNFRLLFHFTLKELFKLWNSQKSLQMIQKRESLFIRDARKRVVRINRAWLFYHKFGKVVGRAKELDLLDQIFNEVLFLSLSFEKSFELLNA